jgi:heat shock protein HtpX
MLLAPAGHNQPGPNGGGAMAARTRYAPDRGLTVRMTATMFLLGLVFVAFIAAIIGIGAAYNASSAAIAFFALVLGGGFAIGSLFYSDKIALRTAGAVEVSPNDGPDAARIHGIVDRLCALADMPKPRVAISNTQMPNAFATGRNADHAVLCVTTGLLRKLENNDELEGVIAHEMSHVAHKDVQVMTAASFLAIVAALLIRIAFYGELFGGGRGRGGNNQNTAIIMFALMAVAIIVYAVSFLLIRMLSRYRELSADRSAALLTGQPSALKSALVKVTGDMARIPTKDLRTVQPMNAFFFAPAMHLAPKGSLANIFSTHPSLDRRLAELDKVQQQLNRTAG